MVISRSLQDFVEIFAFQEELKKCKKNNPNNEVYDYLSLLEIQMKEHQILIDQIYIGELKLNLNLIVTCLFLHFWIKK